MKRTLQIACAFPLLIIPMAAFAQPDPVIALVRLEFSDLTTIVEPVRVVVMPDNGPAPQPRASFHITIRDAYGNPLANAYAFVIFNQAATAALCWCADQDQESWVLPDGRRVFRSLTDANGVTSIQVSAGGCFDQAGAVAFKAGPTGDPNAAVTVRMYNSVGSMDNSGPSATNCDGVVNVRDLQRYTISHMGGPGAYSACHDYNGDGAVNIVDLQLYVQHHVRAAACIPAP